MQSLLNRVAGMPYSMGMQISLVNKGYMFNNNMLKLMKKKGIIRDYVHWDCYLKPNIPPMYDYIPHKKDIINDNHYIIVLDKVDDNIDFNEILYFGMQSANSMSYNSFVCVSITDNEYVANKISKFNAGQKFYLYDLRT